MEAFNPNLQGAELIRYVQAAVLWDFNGSYYFSQGNPTLQYGLLDLVDIAHREVWPAAMLEQRSVANSFAGQVIKVWSLPAAHAEFDKERQDEIRGDYAHRWMEYLRFIDARDEGRETVRDAEELVTRLIDDMIKRDRKFIKCDGGRTSAFSADPYTSHVREYIVRGKETKSLAYDYIFGLAHAALTETRNQTEPTDQQIELESLIGHWEKRHPGATFWAPPDGSNPHIAPVTAEL